MKKLFYALMVGLALQAGSCSKSDGGGSYKTYDVAIRLAYPADGTFTARTGVPVKVKNTINTAVYDAVTGANGEVTVNVPAGVYEISASDQRSEGGVFYVLNGLQSNVVITDKWSENDEVSITMGESKLGQVIIKELYSGGCPKGDASGTYAADKYMILYNNSNAPASLQNLCIAITKPEMAHKSNKDYDEGGKLIYADQGVMPAGMHAFWSIESDVVLNPGEQLVVVLNAAIDNSAIHPASVNLSNAAYYVTWDGTWMNSAMLHPTPSTNIQTSHYLKSRVFGSSVSWGPPTQAPAIFIFTPGDDQTAQSFLDDISSDNYYGGTQTATNKRKMVPVSWVVDGLECYFIGQGSANKKRLVSAIDAGSVEMIDGQGYSMYRNVDKEATEAIEGNAGKLVYAYAYGTAEVNGGSSDLSGIDAEASIKNGARIIYKDTNNSTKDFHLRKQASLKD